MVAAMGILGAAADFRHQSALHERRETRAGRTWRQADSPGDPRCGESAVKIGGESAQDSLIPFVDCRGVTA